MPPKKKKKSIKMLPAHAPMPVKKRPPTHTEKVVKAARTDVQEARDGKIVAIKTVGETTRSREVS